MEKTWFSRAGINIT